MSHRPARKTLVLGACVILIAAMLALPAAPSSAGSLQQATVRPTLTPSSSTPSTVTPVEPAAAIAENAALAGYVWVNGDVFVPAAGVPVRFAGDGFELATLTDVNGYYQFEQVGQDVGLLNVAGNGTPWKASVKDVALSVQPGQTVRVNFSASQASPAKGPALVSVAADPKLVGAGQMVSVTVKATNTTDQKLSGVWLTHLLPSGLTVSGLTTDRGDALAAGRLAVAQLGDLAPGDSATFVVVAQAANDGGPRGSLSLVASLVSREGVAVQASASLMGSGGPATLPTTGSGEWLVWIGLALAALLVGTRQARRRQRESTA